MTTGTDPHPNQTDFNIAYDHLQADAILFTSCQTAGSQSLTTEIDACKNIYEIIALIYSAISPKLEASETPYDAAIKIQADIQRINNDLHAMVNGGSSHASVVMNVYNGANEMQGLFTQNQAPNSLGWIIQEAIGSTASQTLQTNFLNITSTIYTGSGTPPSSATPCIWAGTGTPPAGAITTFAELQAAMGTPGDPSGANTISHNILTATNLIASTLSTQTNVASTNLKFLSAADKAWLSFGNDIIQWFENVMKTAQQHAQNANG